MRNTPIFPWIDDYIEEIIEMMGEDSWAHGIKQNARTLNKFLDYSSSQGLMHNKPDVGTTLC